MSAAETKWTPGPWHFKAHPKGFRKVPPLDTVADAEFVAQIKRLKPTRVKS